jgi:hypothetical protein
VNQDFRRSDPRERFPSVDGTDEACVDRQRTRELLKSGPLGSVTDDDERLD